MMVSVVLLGECFPEYSQSFETWLLSFRRSWAFRYCRIIYQGHHFGCLLHWNNELSFHRYQDLSCSVSLSGVMIPYTYEAFIFKTHQVHLCRFLVFAGNWISAMLGFTWLCRLELTQFFPPSKWLSKSGSFLNRIKSSGSSFSNISSSARLHFQIKLSPTLLTFRTVRSRERTRLLFWSWYRINTVIERILQSLE